MREIKFRGIDTESGKWIYGGYSLLNSGVNCILSGEVSHMRLPESRLRASAYEELNVLQFHAVKYKTVGEYTGLKDRNGKEIYEGDILQSVTTRKYPVCWHSEGRWHAARDDYHAYIPTVDWDKCEVIGNIYEHSHLLEAQNDHS